MCLSLWLLTALSAGESITRDGSRAVRTNFWLKTHSTDFMAFNLLNDAWLKLPRVNDGKRYLFRGLLDGPGGFAQGAVHILGADLK